MMERALRSWTPWLLVVCLPACSDGPQTAPMNSGASDAGAAPGSSPLQSLMVSSGSLQPAFDPDVTDYTVTSLNSLFPITVTATATDPRATLSVHGTRVESGVPLSFTLKPREDFGVLVQSSGAPRTYTVHYVPSDLAAYTVSRSPGAGAEYVLLNPNFKYLLMVDRTGAPLYYRTFPLNQVMDFQQHHLADGATFYSAMVGASAASGADIGVEHLMDAQFDDISDVRLLPDGANEALPTEGHDFLLLEEQHHVAMSIVKRTVDLSGENPKWSSQAVVLNALVQEVDETSVLFEWDSADVPSLYTDSVDGNAFTSNAVSDYLHMNSIDIDPRDNNFVFSFRHTNSIVKVDRKTAQILWTLGGAHDNFGLTADQIFSHQHHARVQSDGSLMVFDNGNNAHQTRILSFVLDEANRNVTSFQVIYTRPADQPQTSFMGSAVRLGAGRYLFGWGGWNGSVIAPAATEVVDGATVWSLTFSGAGVFSYRALPISPL
jgi:arylsulfate sulfotransferase